jgi:hypothetical protein
MSNNSIFISVSLVDELGVSPYFLSENFSFDEAQHLNTLTWFSAILNYSDVNSLIGPLPVFEQPDYEAIIYKFEVINKDSKDERIIANEYVTWGFFIVFFTLDHDESMSSIRKSIEEKMSDYTHPIKDKNDIKQEHIEDILQFILTEIDEFKKEKQYKGKISDQLLVIRHLEMLSKLFNGKYEIAIVVDSENHLNMCRKLFLNDWKNLQLFKQLDDHSFELFIANTRVNVNVMKEYQKIKRTTKHRSIAYMFNIEAEIMAQNDTEDIITKFIKETKRNDQLLLLPYHSSENSEKLFIQSSIPSLISSMGINKSISFSSISFDEPNIERNLYAFLAQIIDTEKT